MKSKLTVFTTWLARAALIVAALCGIVELGAGPGFRLSWWSLGTGIQMIRSAAPVAAGAAAVGLVVALLAWFAQTRGGVRAGVAACVIGVLAAVPPYLMMQRAQQLPRIHDITTDFDQPPSFVAVLPLRKDAKNPVDYVAATAATQRRGYPDIAAMTLPLSPAAAFVRAEAAARTMGWDIVAANANDQRIEATDTSLLFGFKDDVVVRLTAISDTNMPQTRIDVRSLSRVGGSDFGVNAKRVRNYLAKLAAG